MLGLYPTPGKGTGDMLTRLPPLLLLLLSLLLGAVGWLGASCVGTLVTDHQRVTQLWELELRRAAIVQQQQQPQPPPPPPLPVPPAAAGGS